MLYIVVLGGPMVLLDAAIAINDAGGATSMLERAIGHIYGASCVLCRDPYIYFVPGSRLTLLCCGLADALGPFAVCYCQVQSADQLRRAIQRDTAGPTILFADGPTLPAFGAVARGGVPLVIDLVELFGPELYQCLWAAPTIADATRYEYLLCRLSTYLSRSLAAVQLRRSQRWQSDDRG